MTVAATAVSTAIEWTGWADLVFAVSFCALGIACGLTGAVVAARVPGNAVGWLILAIGLGTGLLLATGAYAEAARRHVAWAHCRARRWRRGRVPRSACR